MRTLFLLFLLIPLLSYGQNYSLISFNNYRNPGISQDVMSFIDSNISLRWNSEGQYFEKVQPCNDNLVLNYNNQINAKLSSEKNGTIMHYYSDDNSKPWYEENYKKGKLHGTYKVWNIEGQLMRVTNYKNGVFHGDHKRFYRDGSINYEYTFNQGTGTDKIYDPSGQLLLEINYVDGLTDGSFIEYFPTGDIKTNGFFKEGKYHAEWKIWNKDKQLNFQFSFNEGRLDGIVQKWNDNGNLAFEGEFNNGKRNGSFSTYFDDGTLHSECGFINNTMSGLCIYFTKTEKHYDYSPQCEYYMGQYVGQRFEINYKNGLKDGETRVYDERGNLRSLETYLNDTLDGLQYYFLKDSTKIEHKYHKGAFDKRLKMFWPSGKLKIETHLDQPFTNNSWAYISAKYKIENFPLRFENGIGANLFYVEGAYKTWYPNGQKSIDATFKRGQLNGEFKLWYANGNIKSTGFKQDTLRLGEWKEYNQDGKLIGQASFDDHGKLKYADGIVIDYFKNFSIKSKKTYVKGTLEGEANYYNWKSLDNGQNNICFKKENYKNGKLHGLLTVTDSYDDFLGTDDNYSLIANYKNGLLDGKYEEFHNEEWCKGYRNNSKIGSYTNGLFTGKIEAKTFDGGTELNYSERTENYENGKLLSGKYEAGLDDRGPLLLEFYGADGFEGTRKEWDYHSQIDEDTYRTLILEENYTKGQLHGTRKEWSYEGKLILEENYINDKLHGSKKEWSDLGDLRLKEVYNNGNLNGLRNVWAQNGVLILEENYSNGKLHDIRQEWNDEGVKILEEKYLKGTLLSQKSWYSSGEHKSEKIFNRRGQLKSEKQFNEDGHIESYKTFINYCYQDYYGEECIDLIEIEVFYKNGNVYLENNYQAKKMKSSWVKPVLMSQSYYGRIKGYPYDEFPFSEGTVNSSLKEHSIFSRIGDGFKVSTIVFSADTVSKKHYHRDGSFFLEERYRLADTMDNGTHYAKYFNNVLIEEKRLENEIFSLTKWYPNGNHFLTASYSFPKAESWYKKEFNDYYLIDPLNGNEISINSKSVFSKEYLNGPYLEWHSNGQLALQVNYVMGRREGLEKRWYRNGERQSVVNYKMDSIVGDTKYWKRGGKKQRKGQKNIYSIGGEVISNYEWLEEYDGGPWLGDWEKSSMNYQNTYRVRPFSEDDNKVPSVSSSQYTQDTLSEEVKNLFDEDPMSAWISADMQDNKFEYIEAYSFGDEITAFLNGDNSSIDNWKAYARVKRLRMYKLENGEETYICDIYLKDLMGEQSVQGIPLSQDDRGSFIKLEILELYPGDKYNKVAISEIYH